MLLKLKSYLILQAAVLLLQRRVTQRYSVSFTYLA
uniref:Uncharacterized protein n=1 Tax=Setaria viridis TaxID=4556 RepID=A0A4U6VD39_SETVI|nr:hypothetical protein SEVIR_4G152801v2 [Setaria viridis]